MPFIRNIWKYECMNIHFGFTIFLIKIGKTKKEDDTFPRKKAEEKQNSTTIMISADGIGTAFPVKLKLQGELFE